MRKYLQFECKYLTGFVFFFCIGEWISLKFVEKRIEWPDSSDLCMKSSAERTNKENSRTDLYVSTHKQQEKTPLFNEAAKSVEGL